MENNNNNIRKKSGLTPEQKAKVKKMAVYTGISVLFCLSIWFIYHQMTVGKKQETELMAGMNSTVPQAANEVLPEDKTKAYEEEIYRENTQKRQETINNLSDYFTSRTENETYSFDDNENNQMEQSVSQYRNANRQIASFYEEPTYDYEKELLMEEVEELREKLRQQEENRNDMDEQMKLMEKSYEMAARYMPQTSSTKVNPFETAVERGMNEPFNAHAKAESKEPTLTVYPDVESVVSSLYQEVTDSVFMAEQMQERNRSFLSATETADDIPLKNTLKVSVYETVTLKDGETVRLRLLESARVANMLIPKNTLLTAVARIQSNRLSLSVTSIEHRERIIAVNLSAYDLDGQLGVFIPHSLEVNAAKEIAAGMGQSAGTSFTFASSAGQQLAADAGRGLLQGASQYFGNKMREVKITLKSGHKLFLMTP